MKEPEPTEEQEKEKMDEILAGKFRDFFGIFLSSFLCKVVDIIQMFFIPICSYPFPVIFMSFSLTDRTNHLPIPILGAPPVQQQPPQNVNAPFGSNNFGTIATSPFQNTQQPPIATSTANFDPFSTAAAAPAPQVNNFGQPNLMMGGGIAAPAQPGQMNQFNSMNTSLTQPGLMSNVQPAQPVNPNPSAFNSDPFAGLMQPSQPMAASTGMSSNPSKQNTQNNNNDMFGSNLDDTLNNMMSNFSVAPSGGSGQNNPFAI